MSFKDLREFLDACKEIGELKEINGAHWDLEIGCITELMAERDGPMLLFDNIQGYPSGFRVVSNFISTPRRFALAMGMPINAPPMELVGLWKEKFMNYSPVKPILASGGPIWENEIRDEDIDLYKFPAPKWHEMDGGRYIGTADMVIIKDPETDWVNIGTHRACIHGRDLLSVWIINVKHGRIIAEKYWARGESCPVAVVFGCEPITWICSPTGLPYGVCEYDYAGFLRGAPVELVKGKITSLPFPSSSEIVVEGEIPPLQQQTVWEGPFGEWPGYYAHQGQECVIRVKVIYYRDNPIILGAPPLRPTTNLFGIPHLAAQIWEHLERSGITDVKGVWCYCNNLFVVISIKQRYAGHAKQALLAAAGFRSGAAMWRYFMAVDEDIDPSQWKEVLWALCTRVDPQTSIEILRNVWTSDLDPGLSPEKKEKGDLTTGRALIDACKPFSWKDMFPVSNIFSNKIREETFKKWEREF